MGRGSKKPRHNKLDERRVTIGEEARAKKERDWTFEDIARSKGRRH